MLDTNESIVFVVPGDLHLTEPGLDNHLTALWVMDEVNRLIRPDFVQFIGDNAQNAREEEFRLLLDLRARLTVPSHVLAGDHDVHNDPQGVQFRRFVGQTYGSSSLRDVRFLRLNTVESRPLGLSEEQVRWFRGEVDAAVSQGERIVIFQHHYPYQIWENFAGPGLDAWREIVQTRRIEAIFTGHTHYLQIANDGRNVAVATRSIGDPEGGPPGYNLAYLQGDDLAVAYRAVEDAGPVVLITHPREKLLATGPRHIVRGADEVRVRTWSVSRLKTTQGRVDDGDWFDLRQIEADFWGHPLAGDKLTKGEHALEVQVEDAEGRRGGRRIEFVVDPTGRYTAVPSVRPVVTATAFC